MNPDPLRLRALDLLARGHDLYGGPDLPAALDPPPVESGDPPAGMPARRFARLAAALRVAAATDAQLAALLAQAQADRAAGRQATRAVLDDAHADTLPGSDTPLGRREALRRTAARLRAQHGHVHRSRRAARSLTRRLRGLRYPPDTPAHAPPGGRAIPLAAVRYDRDIPPGPVRGRILAALDRMGITDPRARRNWLRGYQTLIARESSGWPSAVAAQPAGTGGPAQPDGHPLGYARGITQTIPTTFARYHQPGTSANIYDPVANICASMNYVMHRYGVRSDGADLVALVQQADAARPPKGY